MVEVIQELEEGSSLKEYGMWGIRSDVFSFSYTYDDAITWARRLIISGHDCHLMAMHGEKGISGVILAVDIGELPNSTYPLAKGIYGSVRAGDFAIKQVHKDSRVVPFGKEFLQSVKPIFPKSDPMVKCVGEDKNDVILALWHLVQCQKLQQRQYDRVPDDHRVLLSSKKIRLGTCELADLQNQITRIGVNE